MITKTKPKVKSAIKPKPSKARLVYDRDYGIGWKSRKCMTESMALQRALLRTNNPHIETAFIAPESTGYVVVYFPKNSSRAVRESLRRSVEKANGEASGYVFTKCDRNYDDPALFRCFNPLTQSTYYVSATQCSCPHFSTRLKLVNGLHCKHQLAAASLGLFEQNVVVKSARMSQLPNKTFNYTQAIAA